MKTLKYLAIVSGVFLLFAACQKELSFENGLPIRVATGSLKSSLGNCMPVTINGKYVRGTAFTDSNSVIVQVNFSTPGSYSISTDTANGFSFQGSGITADSGLQSIILKGTGTPLAAQLSNFIVTFDTSVCMFSINVADTAITTPVTSADYFPTSDSSNWTYQTNTGDPTLDDTVRVTVSPTDKTIAGNIYKTFFASPDNYESYYRKGGGLYYEYSNLNDISIYDTVYDNVDYIFLKDNVPVSTTWESPEVNAALNSVPGKAKIRFTIEGKDIQTTISTSTIDSVIQVKREYMFAPSATGTYQTLATANFYYAKNIGFIKAEVSDPFSFGIYVTRWEIYY